MKNVIIISLLLLLSCNNRKSEIKRTISDTVMRKSTDTYQIPQNDYKLEGDWQCDSPKNFDFTLYLTNKTRDTLNINYMVGYSDYLAGDSGKILGDISKSALLTGSTAKTIITNTDDGELMNLELTFNLKDTSLLWQIVNYDTTQPLSSMEPSAQSA